MMMPMHSPGDSVADLSSSFRGVVFLYPLVSSMHSPGDSVADLSSSLRLYCCTLFLSVYYKPNVDSNVNVIFMFMSNVGFVIVIKIAQSSSAFRDS
jgi:hypothetical protein